MSSQFRATTPADAPAIANLMREVFGMAANDPGLSPAQLDWKYWRPHPDWEGSRGYVMEREGVIIAHGSVVPMSLVWGKERRKLVHVIDWVALPNSTGAGIAIMKRLGKMVDGVFAAGGSDMTERILPSLGFRESIEASRFALPLRPLARLRGDSWNSWKPAARFGRNLLWRLQARAEPPQGWQARRIENPEKLPAAAPRCPFFERKPADVAFQLECPAVPMELYAVEQAGRVRGHFVLGFAGTQCRIVESWVDGEWQTLYALAIRQALTKPGIAEIATVASTATEMNALQQSGFHRCGQIRLRFWLHDKSVPDAVRFQFADGDLAYLHDGGRCFWV